MVQKHYSSSLFQKVKKVIALSTDKAANPINFMVLLNLPQIRYLYAANNIVGQKKHFSVVRYGNVAGSRGSVQYL